MSIEMEPEFEESDYEPWDEAGGRGHQCSGCESWLDEWDDTIYRNKEGFEYCQGCWEESDEDAEED